MEYALKLIFGFDKESKNKTFEVVAKLILWTNCIALCIWIAEIRGYRIHDVPFSFDSVLNLFTEHYLVLGLLSFIVVHNGLGYSTRIVALVIGYTIIALFVYLRFFKRKSLMVFLLERKVIVKDLVRGEGYDKFVEGMDSSIKDMDNVKTLLDDTSVAQVAIALVYSEIVAAKFPNLYFPWLDAILWSFVVLIIMIYGFYFYVRNKIDKVRKILALTTVPRS